MNSVIASTGFKGSFATSRDSSGLTAFFFDDSASLVRAYRDIAKRAIRPDQAVRKLPRCHTASRHPCSGKSQTTAYYRAARSRRGGRVTSVNT